MRTAFVDALKDPKFLTEAEKAKLEINPVPGARIEELLRELDAVPGGHHQNGGGAFLLTVRYGCEPSRHIFS